MVENKLKYYKQFTLVRRDIFISPSIYLTKYISTYILHRFVGMQTRKEFQGKYFL